jgi:hypothetical protein
VNKARDPDPAKVLQLIRDGEVNTLYELYHYYDPSFEPSRAEYIARMSKELQIGIRNKGILDRILFSLEKAGLITIQGDRLTPTPLIQQVQQALNINLVELSTRSPGTIYAQPLFGKPNENAEAFDVFVVMPFADELKPIYDDHIRKVVRNHLGLSVGRADDVFAASSIISDIWALIYNAKLLIADCTQRNPNVFYEIGVAHTLGRPVILIAQEISDIPFDLRHIRTLVYKYTPPGMKTFESNLEKTIKTEIVNLHAAM